MGGGEMYREREREGEEEREREIGGKRGEIRNENKNKE